MIRKGLCTKIRRRNTHLGHIASVAGFVVTGQLSIRQRRVALLDGTPTSTFGNEYS